MSLVNNIQTVKIASPFHTNDFTRYNINIDSRFRINPLQSTTTNFTINLTNPIKNAVRIRCVSEEIPNNYNFFTPVRKNITIAINYGAGFGTRQVLQVHSGNYSTIEMATELNAQISDASLNWLNVVWDGIQGIFYFIGTQAFQLDTTELTYSRLFDYGLGYYLGFNRGILPSVYYDNKYMVKSDFYANFTGDNYLFLNLNDYAVIQQQTESAVVNYFGKIILTQPKDDMIFDTNASGNVKEIVFEVPTDVSSFNIQIYDAYGQSVDFQNNNVSFTFEVTEVRNLAVFNTIRDKMLQAFCC